MSEFIEKDGECEVKGLFINSINMYFDILIDGVNICSGKIGNILAWMRNPPKEGEVFLYIANLNEKAVLGIGKAKNLGSDFLKLFMEGEKCFNRCLDEIVKKYNNNKSGGVL